jgi:hypothetical protein
MLPQVVTLRVWRVPPARVPAALWRMARDRRRLRRAPGVTFAKLLGTGSATRFGPGDADLTRWAALVCSTGPGPARSVEPVVSAWDRIAVGWCQLDLRPIASRGRWSGVAPFPPSGERGSGPVVAITRARLRAGRAVRFWRAVPPVAAAVATAPGLLATFGIGEAPIGWQGTVSVWETAARLTEFAYRTPAHLDAVARTPAERWYAEELFARFALTGVSGDPSVIGWAG